MDQPMYVLDFRRGVVEEITVGDRPALKRPIEERPDRPARGYTLAALGSPPASEDEE